MINNIKDELKSISGIGKVTIATVMITLLSAYPYVFCRFFDLPNLTIMIALEMIVLIIIDSKAKYKGKLPRSLGAICIVQIMVFFLLFVVHADLFYLMRFALFVIISYYSLYAVSNNVGIIKFVTINNYWLVIQLILGVIGFVLIAAGILSPLLEYRAEGYAGIDYFYGITTTNSILDGIPRIAGYFDEPGALAQWGVFALVLNKLSSHYSKKIEILLIIGLFVSFSMAYYIQLLIYLGVFYYRKAKSFIPIIIVLAFAFIMAQKYIPEGSATYYMTFGRFESTGGRIETNRDAFSDYAKKRFLQSPIIGNGYTNMVENEKGFYDNPYETLATSGLLGTLALYLPLLVILFNYRKSGGWQAVLVLSAGYLQRPFHVQYIHYLMMYILFILCYYKNNPNAVKFKIQK